MSATLRCAEQIAWREWDKAVVVYCDTTGETHFLQDAESEIFQLLARATTSREALVKHLVTLLDEPSVADAEALVNHAVAVMCQRRIIEYVGADRAVR